MNTGEESERVRRHVVYHGRVQGVFFRATSFDLSRNFRVVGYVRNQPDGTVELEAEGLAPEVDRFLAALGKEYGRNVTRAETTALPARSNEKDFRIQY